MRYRSVIAISASSLLAASMLVTTTTSSAQPQDASKKDGATYAGSFALSGEEAAGYALPDDVQKVWTNTLPGGLTQTRYQQYVGEASVFGGQVTVIKDAAGSQQSVIGAHFPGLEAVNDKSADQGQGPPGRRGSHRGPRRLDLHPAYRPPQRASVLRGRVDPRRLPPDPMGQRRQRQHHQGVRCARAR